MPNLIGHRVGSGRIFHPDRVQTNPVLSRRHPSRLVSGERVGGAHLRGRVVSPRAVRHRRLGAVALHFAGGLEIGIGAVRPRHLGHRPSRIDRGRLGLSPTALMGAILPAVARRYAGRGDVSESAASRHRRATDGYRLRFRSARTARALPKRHVGNDTKRYESAQPSRVGAKPREQTAMASPEIARSANC